DNMHLQYRTFIVIDIIESLLAMQLDDFEKELPEYMHLAYLPTPG
ncbi:MAG TPA: competence/damage-inducible protein A, partial [Porphyromonadaceae bacterium]|nr:competence/damage-inducible protein A [Porphyromonadaceae bacterium]